MSSGRDSSPPPVGYTYLSEVIKSPLDSNEYKAIQLSSNGLKALLIHNSQQEVDIVGDRHGKATCAFQRILEFNKKYLNMEPPGEKSEKLQRKKHKPKAGCPYSRMCRGKAARGEEEKGIVIVSISISSGKFHDPKEAQGLAHFCEHAIFCGSKNYPELEAFQNFLANNGGECNARTEPECTTYFFRIFQESLDEALTILVDSIVNPTMQEDRVMNELKAVQAEFAQRRLDDEVRIGSLIQSCVRVDHPCGNAGDGNERSLNIPDILNILSAWKEKNYLGNYMTLVIKGPIQISKLKSLVVKNFSQIPKGCGPSPTESLLTHGPLPYDLEKWAKLYKVFPIVSQELLKVSWFMEPEVGRNFRTKPLLFIHWLLDQKAEGGLVQYLKRKGWIFNMCVGCGDTNITTNMFFSGITIQFVLTNDGFVHYVDVIKALFAYLKLMLREHPSERLFHEFKILNADLFHYMSDRNLESPFGSDDSQYEGNIMLIKELSELLHTYEPRDLFLVKYLVSEYNEEFISACLEKMTPKRANFVLTSRDYEKESNLFNPWYKVKYSCEVPNFVEELENVEIPTEMYLPPPNQFIDESLCYPLDANEKLEIDDERAILKTDKARIYYLKSSCIQGYLPTANYYLQFKSAEGNSLLQGNWCLIDILTKALEYTIHLNMGTALNALITCDFQWNNNSLELCLFGPSNKLPELLEIALQSCSNVENVITKPLFEDMAELAIDNMTSILETGEKFSEELMQAILEDRHISAPRHQQFLSRVRYEDFVEFCTLFRRKMFIYGVLLGCITKTQTMKISKVIEKMDYQAWLGARWFPDANHAIILPVGERCLRVRATNDDDSNSVIRNHYQIGKINPTQSTIMDIVVTGLENFAFERLRSIEYLGYVVELSIDDYLTTRGVTISVISQANRYTTAYVDERIDAVIQAYYDQVVLNRQKFKDFQQYLKDNEKMTWEDVKKFFEDYFLSNGAEFRKLSIQVVGHIPSESTRTPKDADQKKISQKVMINSSRDESYDEANAKVNPSYPYSYLLPKGLKQRNGYFITDIQDFKNRQGTYGVDPDPADTSSDSGGNESEDDF